MKKSRLPKKTIAALAPYFPDINLKEVEIITGVPWYVPMKAGAYTDRNRIYFADGFYNPNSPVGLALIAHELTHVEQYKKHGKWKFRLLYSRSWLVELLRNLSFNQAYKLNRFEVAAREVESQVYCDLCDGADDNAATGSLSGAVSTKSSKRRSR